MRCVALRCVALRCVALRCVALRVYSFCFPIQAKFKKTCELYKKAVDFAEFFAKSTAC
ncbi:hypothetical protein F543_11920 [Bibersteinia trehalosi USDA-ARS-USMARC-189]|uniref:Secreted protein n=1 Tax=Bibersteinia trehalosi USDA-ARS-USMARC-189 TaxID=1263831 RepID=A0ABM5PCF1_BIBTR|nr:hypothetical protein WQG_11530 [Bibersteinia trehalosi USDA-ARS-USMARC-192]AHG84056.1 hypothetical protein F543_11920 [Bibersteinia trehalosi USDA-ARS-USMARC-189]